MPRFLMLVAYVNEVNSIVKKIIYFMNNYLEREAIIERAMLAFNCKTEKQLADLFDISAQDLSNRKRTGTYIKLIEKEAYKQSKNINWIKTGQGNMKNGEYEMAGSLDNPVSDPYAAYQSKKNTFDLIHKTRAVLGSNTIYSNALKDIIVAYYEATICQEELAEKEKALNNPSAKESS